MGRVMVATVGGSMRGRVVTTGRYKRWGEHVGICVCAAHSVVNTSTTFMSVEHAPCVTPCQAADTLILPHVVDLLVGGLHGDKVGGSNRQHCQWHPAAAHNWHLLACAGGDTLPVIAPEVHGVSCSCSKTQTECKYKYKSGMFCCGCARCPSWSAPRPSLSTHTPTHLTHTPVCAPAAPIESSTGTISAPNCMLLLGKSVVVTTRLVKPGLECAKMM